MSAIGGPNVIDDGLVLALDAGNHISYPGSGTVWTDLSGQSNNGTLTNGPTFNSDNGGSIVFDGSNDYVAVSHNTTLNANLSMTLSAWVNISTFVTDNSIFGKGSTTSGQGGYDFRINSSTQLNLVKYFVVDQTVTLSTPLSTNTWYNITAVQSSTKVDYFVNASNVGTFNNSNAYQTNTIELRVGRDRNIIYSSANISQVYKYNKILTSDEIRQNYNATKGRFGL
jgi:hypothetical protein